jgi:uncharacterized protein
VAEYAFRLFKRVLIWLVVGFITPTQLWADSAYAPTPIYAIQGNGPASPLAERWVDVVGVVTGLTAAGFYLQDPSGDGDPATSDGIFVYTYDPPTVAQGQCVLVTRALVSEFYEKTELSRMKTITPDQRCPLTTVTPLPVPLPYFGSSPAELYERYEGMVVTMSGLTGRVQGPTKWLRSGVGELAITPAALTPYLAGGRVFQHEPAAAAALIHLSSALGATLPEAGWGDELVVGRLQGDQPVATGVLDYNFGKYQLLLAPNEWIERRPRAIAEEQTTPVTADQFTVCSLNLYGLGRGAAQYINEVAYQAQLRLRALVIQERLQGCTIIGLQEAGSPEDAERLAAELRDHFALPYTATAFPSPQSQEVDFPLTNALLTRTDRVQVRNAGVRQACTGQDYAVTILPGECPADRFALFDRTPLVADLAVTGDWGAAYPLRVIVNHWKSKAGDETVNVVRREEQARFVATLVQEAVNTNPEAHVIVLGDLNDYYGSTPVETLRTGVQPPLVHTFEFLRTLDRYSYIFNGASQVLDHVLVSPAVLPALAEVDILHVNVDFPYPAQVDLTNPHHASDHEPLLLRLRPAGAAMIGGNVRYPGRQVTLLDGAGQPVGVTLTDALGDFRFWNLQPGPARLRIDTPDYLSLPVQDMTLLLQPGYNGVNPSVGEHQNVAIGAAAVLLGNRLAHHPAGQP